MKLKITKKFQTIVKRQLEKIYDLTFFWKIFTYRVFLRKKHLNFFKLSPETQSKDYSISLLGFLILKSIY